MREPDLQEQLLDAWRRNNDILVYLVDQIPAKSLSARPAESRGRDVVAQLAHLAKVRNGWLHYFRTGQRPKAARYDKSKPPTKAQVRKVLVQSGRAVELHLRAAFEGTAKTRMFGGNPARWLAYLIAHDSHHRGQMLLALKQSGQRLPETVATQGVWGKWIYGK